MIYDEFGKTLAAQYESFLFGLSGQYLALAAPGLEVTPMVVGQLESGALHLRNTFLDTARRTTQGYLDSIGVDDPERVEILLDDLADFTAQNINGLVQRMKGNKNTLLDLMDDMHGAMGLLLQRKLAEPEFKVKTLSGREFDAAPLVRATGRDFAYRSWLMVELTAIKLGSDLAQVVYADPQHDGHGTVFSISGDTPGYPKFTDLYDEVFHYNATARVAAHVPT